MALSEDLVNDLMMVLLDEDVTTIDDERSEDFGAFSLGYDIEGRFEHGEHLIDFQSDPDEVLLDELDILWDTFDVDIAVDIPEVCVGGFCLIPSPWGCVVRAPEICVFEGGPEIDITLPLDWVRSEVSLTADLAVGYGSYRGGRSYLDAQLHEHDLREADRLDEEGPVVNAWEVGLHPDTFDIDFFDVPDMIGDLLDDAVEAVVDGLLGWLPGWARDALHAIFGSLVDLVRAVLDIPDDVAEWLSDMLGVSLDLLGLIAEIIDDFLFEYPVLRIEDPFPVLDWEPPLGTAPPPGEPRLIPVKVPIEEFAVDLRETEAVLTATIGGVGT
jgi:hypothetical protein